MTIPHAYQLYITAKAQRIKAILASYSLSIHGLKQDKTNLLQEAYASDAEHKAEQARENLRND